ncbi:hypothetical protein HY490_03895 [Candidatus Woesearchaeota archaeon]|nr:hypothetical protein [Candidatus Woesearchaeota archaeon]
MITDVDGGQIVDTPGFEHVLYKGYFRHNTLSDALLRARHPGEIWPSVKEEVAYRLEGGRRERVFTRTAVLGGSIDGKEGMLAFDDAISDSLVMAGVRGMVSASDPIVSRALERAIASGRVVPAPTDIPIRLETRAVNGRSVFGCSDKVVALMEKLSEPYAAHMSTFGFVESSLYFLTSSVLECVPKGFLTVWPVVLGSLRGFYDIVGADGHSVYGSRTSARLVVHVGENFSSVVASQPSVASAGDGRVRELEGLVAQLRGEVARGQQDVRRAHFDVEKVRKEGAELKAEYEKELRKIYEGLCSGSVTGLQRELAAKLGIKKDPVTGTSDVDHVIERFRRLDLG